MSHSYRMVEGDELAAFTLNLRTQERRQDDVRAMFAAIPQAPAAALASMVDDAWIYALETYDEEGDR